MFKLKTALEKEWDKIIKQETNFLIKKAEKQQSKLNSLLEEKVPENLQSTLDKAFAKAFDVVFSKGTGIIEKTYNKEKAEDTYIIHHLQASKSKPKRKALRAFSKTAGKASNVNLAVSTISGVGLGILGIGIPDIVLFVSLVLKSLYQIATSYGCDYRNENEKKWLLLLIKGALTFGDEQKAINQEVDHYIKYGTFIQQTNLNEDIQSAATCLSKELLYMKFLQGIPLVGAVGGAYDFVYMKEINKYAKLKCHKRFLYNKMPNLE